ncbi:hypothetical protein E2C01_026138 [Portunus trituberculatus]|uniref:Uncharacterized protein n=1 Tax=Portunus trituberculatus TaxID=210409 RepID=A0A5B7EHB4_PORTR|nr:hypothetical protein [Portunus trituberculatus]
MESPEEMVERLPSRRFTHFGSVTFERREPEGFDASDGLPSSTVSRTNPLVRLSSLEGERASVDLEECVDFNSMRRVKLSSFPKDHYWFRSQKDREDSVMETRAETIYDDREEDERRPSTTRVVFAQTDEASFS